MNIVLMLIGVVVVYKILSVVYKKNWDKNLSSDVSFSNKTDESFILQIKTVQTPFTWEVCTVEKFILVKNKSTYRNCLAVFCPLIGKVDRIFCVWIFHTQ